MDIRDTRTFPQAGLTLELYSNDVEHVVSITFYGEYWDHKDFACYGEAKEFMNDPFAYDRAREIRRAEFEAKRTKEHDDYFAASQERISRGRRIGPKPPAG